MAFIEKKDPVVLNIKLTTCGRELLSTGSLNFKYFAIGDSEIDYVFANEVSAVNTDFTPYTPFYSKILRPVDVNPNIISFIPQNVSGDPYNVISSVPSSSYIVANPIEPVGFFNNSGTSFLFDSNHVKQPDIMIYMSTGVNVATKQLSLFKSPSYGASGQEPEVGDLLLVKWTITGDTTSYAIDKTKPTPYLIYRINAKTGTLASNTLIVTVDRSLPNFGGAATGMAGAMVYYNLVNFTGDTILNQYSTEYIDSSVLAFLTNSQCDTATFPFWNMSIIFTDNIAGVQVGDRTFGQYNSVPYGGFVSYIQNQAAVLKKLGAIHYTNPSPANVYAEGFYQTTPRLDIPTIMWHKSLTKKLGLTLTALGEQQLLTGETKSLNLVYYDLADPDGNIVGKIFTDLKIFVIEDQELLFALSYKSNRSWTLPNYIISQNRIVGCF